MARNSIVTQSAHFVATLLARRHPPWAHYHNSKHTAGTVAACRRIGKAAGLNPDDLEVVTVAGWFHDTGYTVKADGHEEESAAIAQEFLTQKGLPAATIRKILGCIMVTKVPQRPRNLRERVICDADMVSLGRPTFLAQNELLRKEIAEREKQAVDSIAWLRRTYRFLQTHRFHTRYGRTVLERGRQKNLAAVHRRVRRMDTKAITGKAGRKKGKRKEPVRKQSNAGR